MNHYEKNDELSFLGVMRVFWLRKWVIFFVMIFTTLVWVLALGFKKPIYTAQALIGPPLELEVLGLNLNPFFYLTTPKQKKLNQETVYDLFVRNLLSPITKQIFYTQDYHKLVIPDKKLKQLDQSQQEKMYKSYLDIMIFSTYQRIKPYKFMISFNADNPETARMLLEAYLALANKRATDSLKQLLLTRNKKIMQSLEEQINALNKMRIIDESTNHINNIAIDKQNQLTNLIQIYEKNYNSYTRKISASSLKLYQLAFDISVTNTAIDDKIKKALLLGVLSGLVTGFFLVCIMTPVSRARAIA
ncbi:Wzz/FepE/Etk N-terminal domain-containing protein [Legionella shakespearei]|uniref:Polysaccharide chain length determinant N-terminal domain-containing protein n=1 Tax=Legionella shakespearei DSM 23087 TaxID=1122169 RepID=A0A0W0YV50_9GAMM|nr:Wzz/FepE/Etk N-terminal domain-containing protein [Legionella shakespearei]KTD60738.1 hypothetical protein Lsha_1455 [Legionella shakespearei DSM 23087]